MPSSKGCSLSYCCYVNLHNEWIQCGKYITQCEMQRRPRFAHIGSGFLQVIEMGLLKLDNAYKFPNLRCRGWACRTNLPSNTALRGFGFPQAGLVTEACITEVAIKCGLSPEQVTLL